MLSAERLRGVVLAWTMFLSVFAWTPTMRALLRPELSHWSLFGVAGQGASGAFWVLPAWCLYSLALFYIEGRRRVRPLFHAMLLAWHLPLTAAVVYAAIREGSSAQFVGGAWGVRVGFPLLALPLLAFTALAVMWIRRERRTGVPLPAASWTELRWRPLGIALALFPVAWLLFRAAGSEGYDWKAKLAIAVNVIQWILILEAVNGSGSKAARETTGRTRVAPAESSEDRDERGPSPL